jgi:hypothetical protein
MQSEFGGHVPPEFNAAFRIFINPNARSVMALLLLSQGTDEEIIEVVKNRYDIELDDNSLAFYRDIFWDVTLMGRKSWGAFMGSLRTKDERHYVGLGLSSPTIEDVQRALGLGVTLEPEAVLRTVMEKTLLQFLSMMEHPDPEMAGALKWAAEARACATSLRSGKNAWGTTEAGAVPANFNDMFSVVVTKSKQVSLSDLQGEIGAPKDLVKNKEEA